MFGEYCGIGKVCGCAIERVFQVDVWKCAEVYCSYEGVCYYRRRASTNSYVVGLRVPNAEHKHYHKISVCCKLQNILIAFILFRLFTASVAGVILPVTNLPVKPPRLKLLHPVRRGPVINLPIKQESPLIHNPPATPNAHILQIHRLLLVVHKPLHLIIKTFILFNSNNIQQDRTWAVGQGHVLATYWACEAVAVWGERNLKVLGKERLAVEVIGAVGYAVWGERSLKVLGKEWLVVIGALG